MARVSSVDVLSRRNSKLDSFLKRNTERGVYERIRAYEPCVVISEAVNKVYMHVILSDECVYLAEYPPRKLTAVLSFSQIRNIALVNDLPDFLSGKDREYSQHVCVLYSTNKPAGKRGDWGRKGKKAGLPVRSFPSRRNLQLLVSHGLEGVNSWRISPDSHQRDLGATCADVEEEQVEVWAPRSSGRSASCPNPDTMGLGGHPLPRRCTTTTPSTPGTTPRFPLSLPTSPLTLPEAGAATEPRQVSRRRHFVLDRLLRRDRKRVDKGERDAGEREAELHLYSVSRTSRIYLHLQNSWNSYIIRSTLMLDPLYRTRCGTPLHPCPRKRSSPLSWERRAHLFSQLTGEMLQGGLGVERLYLLLQELRTAAQRNVALRKLFWRSSDVCVFLVRTLEDSLQSCQSPESPPTGGHTTDQLLLCTLIAQTLAVMFRETEVEPARNSMLTAKRGALTGRMLLAMVCDPQLHTQSQEPTHQSELQTLLAEYLGSACSLLFELVLLGQEASRGSSLVKLFDGGLAVRSTASITLTCCPSWATAPPVISVRVGLPGPATGPEPGPERAPLPGLSGVLLASLQHSQRLRHYLALLHYHEDVPVLRELSRAAERLPPHYPSASLSLGLIHQLLTLISAQTASSAADRRTLPGLLICPSTLASSSWAAAVGGLLPCPADQRCHVRQAASAVACWVTSGRSASCPNPTPWVPHPFATRCTTTTHLNANCPLSRVTLMLDRSTGRGAATPLHPCPRKRSYSGTQRSSSHPRGLMHQAAMLGFYTPAGRNIRAQGGLGVEKALTCCCRSLRTAAQRNVALRKLFWRSSDVCVFLVRTLEDSLQSCQSPESPPTGGHTTDQLLLCTLIAQTLAVMFRETEVEPARNSMLTAKRGALTGRMLLAMVCDPQLHTQSQEPTHQSELQTLLAEYLGSACSLLFELVLLGQEASRGSSLENFLTVGWLFGVLHTHPHLLPFMGYQAQQVISVLSDPRPPVLSPAQSVLLFQGCRVLLASLQHSQRLRHYLHSHYHEEFRYCVKLSSAAERLPPHYPISQPALGLIHQLLTLILPRLLPVSTLAY
ncbi:unnamed protein product [Arctogadus glacialis]